MRCAAVGGDGCEGPVGSGEGAQSGFCSRACGAERLLETGSLTAELTAKARGRGLELCGKKQRNESFRGVEGDYHT